MAAVNSTPPTLPASMTRCSSSARRSNCWAIIWRRLSGTSPSTAVTARRTPSVHPAALLPPARSDALPHSPETADGLLSARAGVAPAPLAVDCQPGCSQIRLNRRGTQRAEGDLRTIFMNPQILSHGAEWMVLALTTGGATVAHAQEPAG